MPTEAIAFLGDSVSTDAAPSNGLAFGLQFSGDYLVKETFPQLTGDPAGTGRWDVIRPYVWTNATVLFFGACDLRHGPDFGRVLDMMWFAPGRDQSKPRAMIYGWNPNGGKVDLVGARVAWNEVLFHLLLGDDVDTAVAAANTAIKNVTKKVPGEDRYVPITDKYDYWGSPWTKLF
jgi:hypothetical protein